ncbi:hypothetical protein [Capnocytophaga periodontitidis]|jgi:hypothetical protein|uniref:hypothetical protein n=1 Tax=Capnocytophaga periodontitidis TaxID=2795027 RepID=UPI0018E0C896|nr:hypothetical protein [Capnocytophaga periodontitidis]MBI1667055.1 hypothetical protein [Capnocytophaga periodontitidis]
MKTLYFLVMLWLFNCHNTTSIDRDDISVEKDTVVVCAEEDLSVRKDPSEDSEFVSRYDLHLPDENKNLIFLPDKKEAFLLGDSIPIYNHKGFLKEKRTDLDTKWVAIVGVSDTLYNFTKDNCTAFHYIKIVLNNTDSLIVDGRNVFRTTDKLIDKTFDNGERIQFFRTAYYGTPVSDDDGLTFCGEPYQPAILITNTGFKGLVPIGENNSLGINRKMFQFFELCDNDGFLDEVMNAVRTSKGIVLKIYREFQEGYTNYEVLLEKTTEGYKVTRLNYPKIKIDQPYIKKK